ncbi:MAG: SDR family oxidoreductase [Hyphomicrobiaceae bacterium]|nr:SDR family oxidoreductase [Hyphomicrobiaceae bacterium]
MDLGLKGKVVLVTAATGGLGLAIAREFAAEGASVVLCGRTQEKIDSCVDSIRKSTGGAVEGARADLSNAGEIDAMVAGAEARHGHIDVLINNSGGPRTKPFTDLSDQDWLDAFDVKFLPQIRCARAVFPGMVKRRSGRIITIIGTHGRTPHAYAFTAGIVNAALLNLTKTLAEVGAPDNVLVNAINPGWMDTERMAYVLGRLMQDAGLSEEEARKRILVDTQLGRPGKPEDVAAAAAFLASSRASFITGAFLDIDGGLTRTI